MGAELYSIEWWILYGVLPFLGGMAITEFIRRCLK